MVKINMAEFDAGVLGTKKVKVRDYLRTLDMWRA
jgi:hypothetical protein